RADEARSLGAPRRGRAGRRRQPPRRSPTRWPTHATGAIGLGNSRLLPLPARTLTLLRESWVTHRNPVWLFPDIGSDPRQAVSSDRPMSQDGVQHAMQRVVHQLGWRKAVSIHTLRHSYAPHLGMVQERPF